MTDQDRTSAPGPFIYKMVHLHQTSVVKKDILQRSHLQTSIYNYRDE
jgi:hypothetical protein